YSDGHVHLTKRANLQLRKLSGNGQQLTPEALADIEATGLLPSKTHELVRNILVSPQTGIVGGRMDLRPVVRRLDAALCADPELARLPGRFLFTLDDGRGDLIQRLTGSGRGDSDLGLVALGDDEVQLRVGGHWGEVVRFDEAAAHLAGLAAAFVVARGSGTEAPWHLRELPTPLRRPVAPDSRLPVPTQPLPHGVVPGGTHEHVPDGVLAPPQARRLLERVKASVAAVVVTPWHGIFVPHAEEAR
ncbi:MAG: nitrite reductase, partial [Trebonia sp.]